MICSVLSWIILLVTIVSGEKVHHNVYQSVNGQPGPDDWPNQHPVCGGRSQSPIDILTNETIYSPYLTEFEFSAPSPRSKFVVHNNGHSIVVDTKGNFYVHRGGLEFVHSTAQLHFHWGDTDQHGAEHTVNGVSYPLEMHIVNWNSDKYGSFNEALEHPDGIAVLGVLFEISKTDNAVLDPVFAAVQHVRDPDWDNRVEIPATIIRNLLPNDIRRFYRYHGSLTTPTCQESVIWTVFQKTLPISERQLNGFRRCLTPTSNAHGNHGVPQQQDHAAQMRESLVNNYRPVQPLYERQVYRSYSFVPTFNFFSKLL